MKTLLNILTKGLASFLFVALLAVNVQVGSSGSFSFINSNTSEVKAAPCDPANDYCRAAIVGDIIIVDPGQPIVVTPEKK